MFLSKIVDSIDYVAYVHATEGITGVLITDETYPYRVGFDVTRKLIAGFDKDSIKSPPNKDFCIAEYSEQIKTMIKKYQNPMEADEILKLKKAIDEILCDGNVFRLAQITPTQLVFRSETLLGKQFVSGHGEHVEDGMTNNFISNSRNFIHGFHCCPVVAHLCIQIDNVIVDACSNNWVVIGFNF